MFLVAINMETLLSSPSSASTVAAAVTPKCSKKKILSPKLLLTNFSFSGKKTTQHNFFFLLSTTFSSSSNISTTSTTTKTLVVRRQPPLTSSDYFITNPLGPNNSNNRHWMVLMADPPPLQEPTTSKSHIIDHYVSTLQRVLASEKDAQMCIYHASCDTHFGFCCDIDEQTAHQLASVPGVLSVKPDPDFDSIQKDYSYSNFELNAESSRFSSSPFLFPSGTAKHWLVRMDRPSVGAIRKAQVVDYFVQVLIRVLGNEKDAQMCIYHVSWESNYGFCCELDDECARDLAGVPGVLLVQPDENFRSDDKDYGGENIKQFRDSEDSSASTLTSNIKTKKLFITGLSFYTSEKTLRAAFEGFGELVEVKIIMDKISKRSKGYGFVEYTSEEAASTALREMNGKIINGWMITVDVAKTNPPKYNRGQPRFMS